MDIRGVQVNHVMDIYGMAKATKAGAVDTDFSSIDTERRSHRTALDASITECNTLKPTSSTRRGAFGCNSREDVVFLLEKNIIDRCSSKKENTAYATLSSLDVAKKHYAAHMEDGSYFNLDDWKLVCDFSEDEIREITSISGKYHVEL